MTPRTGICVSLPPEDAVDPLDRVVVVREHSDRLYLPQQIPVAVGLPPASHAGIWHVLRAHVPVDAFGHVRALLDGDTQHKPQGSCNCPVESLGAGDWPAALAIARGAGADVSRRPVPDIRVPMSWTPRWNDKTAGGWTAPLP
jgi:hypothetical protein